MKFQNKELTIRDLLELIDKRKIDLQPPYQRNFIWTNKDQQLLIDSILKGYPLPNFFTYKNPNGSLEMVDGQQRARTISRFAKGEIKTSEKKLISDIDKDSFFDYKLNVVELFDKSTDVSLEEFYALVNKRGEHLNPAEINKAYYHDSMFLKLVNDVMTSQELIDLGIFSDKSIARMNDRSLVEELVAYLFKGITEKRKAVEDLFNSNTTVEEKYDEKKERFNDIIKKIYHVNNRIKAINETRYKQRNDFYTLFCFVDQHFDFPIDVFEYQYKILAFFDEKSYISPTNEECDAFREYALNCVSQSNSKNARLKRLEFFNSILCNEDLENNEILKDVESYFEAIYNIDRFQWKQIGEFQLIELSQFS